MSNNAKRPEEEEDEDDDDDEEEDFQGMFFPSHPTCNRCNIHGKLHHHSLDAADDEDDELDQEPGDDDDDEEDEDDDDDEDDPNQPTIQDLISGKYVSLKVAFCAVCRTVMIGYCNLV